MEIEALSCVASTKMENGIYFLTVNFREDPLGFPSSRNLTIPQMEQILDVKFENPTGVIYDNSKVWAKRQNIVEITHRKCWRHFPTNIPKTTTG